MTPNEPLAAVVSALSFASRAYLASCAEPLDVDKHERAIIDFENEVTPERVQRVCRAPEQCALNNCPSCGTRVLFVHSDGLKTIGELRAVCEIGIAAVEPVVETMIENEEDGRSYFSDGARAGLMRFLMNARAALTGEPARGEP